MSNKLVRKSAYSLPSFGKLDASEAKAMLEAKAITGDAGAGAMMKLIAAPTNPEARRRINFLIQGKD
jgi:hypothetical protein